VDAALLIVVDDPVSDNWLREDAPRSSYGESNDACGGSDRSVLAELDPEYRGETLGGVGVPGPCPNMSWSRFEWLACLQRPSPRGVTLSEEEGIERG